MAKRQGITQAEQTRLVKENLKRFEKYQPRRLSPQTRKDIENLKQALYGKRTITAEQKAQFKQIKQAVQTEQASAEAKQWQYRKQASERKLEKDIAEKIKGKGEKKKLAEYESDFAKGIKKQLEKIKDIDYKTEYHEYSIEQKQDMLRRLLGIGSRGVTLSDGSIFTIDEFNAVLDRYNIPLEKFVDEEDIRKERYKQVKYKEWKASIDVTIKELLSKQDLTAREREGLKKIFKVYGT